MPPVAAAAVEGPSGVAGAATAVVDGGGEDVDADGEDGGLACSGVSTSVASRVLQQQQQQQQQQRRQRP